MLGCHLENTTGLMQTLSGFWAKGMRTPCFCTDNGASFPLPDDVHFKPDLLLIISDTHFTRHALNVRHEESTRLEMRQTRVLLAKERAGCWKR